MIADSLDRIDLYHLNPFGQSVLTALRQVLAQPCLGVHSLAPNCQATVFGYESQPEAQEGDRPCPIPYESHRAMVDVQVLLEGEEYLDIYSSPQLRPKGDYDPSKDVEFYHEIPPAQVRVHMRPGMFALLWPTDAHRSGISVTAHGCPVLKVVVKIPVHALNPV